VTERKKDTAATRFAANVRARRELNGMSQRALAQAMIDLGHGSFRQQTIAEIEAGGRQVKLEEALAISRALGISMDNLVRPAGLTRQASELLAAAREMRETTRQVRQWVNDRDAARRRLEKALAAAGAHESELADELAVAQRAQAETE
jgi:transcriptional regulator with XRE-family HTH domain